MTEADDVMAYFTEYKQGDEVRIVMHQPGGHWPPIGTSGRIVMRSVTGRSFLVEYLHDGAAAIRYVRAETIGARLTQAEAAFDALAGIERSMCDHCDRDDLILVRARDASVQNTFELIPLGFAGWKTGDGKLLCSRCYDAYVSGEPGDGARRLWHLAGRIARETLQAVSDRIAKWRS